jgi:hypothetical protein
VSYDDWKCTEPPDLDPHPRECGGCGSMDRCKEGCPGNEGYPGPYVCPGCYAVDEPCLPGCVDARIEAERREAQESGDYGISEDDDDICF